MCEFCENPTKWNTDDYSLVPNRNLSDGIMQAEESWWKNDIVQNSIVCLLSLIVMVHKEIQKY